ncbi:hypothetical protein [Phytohabitans kaempferiae]|uniref:Fibronectin type-III domain-containing protein n=1 Tax=Phytohabitans kaempferiae TaxID=1620943 RepID=A0ABV6LWM4_9ACTN
MPPPICGEQPEVYPPTGTLTQVQRVPAGVSVAGTASDDDAPSSPVSVDITIDGARVGTLVANQTGKRYSGVVPARAGSRVCAIARDIGGGGDTTLGCVNTTIRVDPFGAWEALWHDSGRVRVKGWAIDPDSTAALSVEARDNAGALLATIPANVNRPDIGQANAGYGDYHGFDAQLPEKPADGSHQICLTMVNLGAGTNTGLGCKSYTVKHQPFGVFESLVRDGEQLALRGWAADPDGPTAQIDVDYYIDGVLRGTERAGKVREDVANDWPGYGPYHGFETTLPANMSAGNHTVCVKARNILAGVDPATQIGCHTYSVKAAVATPRFDPATVASTSIRIDWADDPVAQGFRIERSADGGPWRMLGEWDYSWFVDSGLRPGHDYCYRVTASNDRPSSASAETCHKTLLLPLPAASGLTQSAGDASSATVKWNDNATTETGYVLTWNRSGASPSEAKRVELPARAGTGEMVHRIGSLEPNTWYWVTVTPVNPAHEAAPVAGLSVRTTP